MYLESSKDILFLVLAFCALWFTLFVCWALWYVIKMLRDASAAVNEVRDKLEHSASYLGVVASGVKILIDVLHKNKEKVADKAEEAASRIKRKAKKVVEEIMDEE